MHFGTRPGEDMKIASDNIVEGMEIDLNNFIRLRKNPSRQYHREETNSSKPEWQKKLLQASLNPSFRRKPESRIALKSWIPGRASLARNDHFPSFQEFCKSLKRFPKKSILTKKGRIDKIKFRESISIFQFGWFPFMKAVFQVNLKTPSTEEIPSSWYFQ